MSDPISVVVCTRGRPGALARCLASLRQLDPPPGEIVVVDNHDEPTIDAAMLRIAGRRARTVHVPQRGLDRARSAGVAAVCGDVVAFTDDDCEVDPGWVGALARAFAADPAVGLVTGRVVAADTSGPAAWFEARFSFDRGPDPHRFEGTDPAVGTYPWQLGTGANMAFRREVFDVIPGFDPELDMGTRIGGGGDLDVFAQVLDAGYAAAYAPDARVTHHHRSRRRDLLPQFHGYGRTVGALTTKYVTGRPGHRRSMLAFVRTYLRDTLRLVFAGPDRRSGVPRYLLVTELLGIAVGAPLYLWATRRGAAS